MESEQHKGGIVYLLTNEAMPGYVKIGKTSTSIEQRVLELSRSTAVPVPFECFYAAKVADVSSVERALHEAFGDHRANPRREFFNIAPERVVAVLRLLSLEEVTPGRNTGVETEEDAVALEQARSRRQSFNFSLVNIPAGSELEFTRDETVTCVVADDQKHVVFKGVETSLSAAAKEALGVDWPVQGPLYWKYNGEILDEIRNRMESE